MKSRVAVALIVMGTVLILAPVAADWLFQRNLVFILTKEQSATPALMPQLSAWYRIICWLTGSLMVLIATLGSVARNRATYYEEANEETDDEDDDRK
jgi:hypothetical protein